MIDLVELIVKNRDAIKTVCAKYSATDVRVFGSCVHDTFRDDSDIDILVKVDQAGLNGLNYFSAIGRLHDELTQLLGVPVDLIDELACTVSKEVLKECVPL